MDEHRAVIARDHRVPRHAHVRLEHGGSPIAPRDREREGCVPVHDERRVSALPRHRGPIAQHCGVSLPSSRLPLPRFYPGIVRVGRPPCARRHRHVDAREQRLGEPALVHDVGVDAIAARRQRGQVGFERRRVVGQGMQVGKRIEGRIPHEEQVHQVTVVGDERRPLALGIDPRGVIDREPEDRPGAGAAHRGGGVERAVQAAPVRGVHAVPPRPAAERREREQRGARGHGEPSPPDAPSIGRDARLEHALAHGRANDRDRARKQQRAQRNEPGGEGLRERQASGGDGHDRNEYDTRAL